MPRMYSLLKGVYKFTKISGEDDLAMCRYYKKRPTLSPHTCPMDVRSSHYKRRTFLQLYRMGTLKRKGRGEGGHLAKMTQHSKSMTKPPAQKEQNASFQEKVTKME